MLGFLKDPFCLAFFAYAISAHLKGSISSRTYKRPGSNPGAAAIDGRSGQRTGDGMQTLIIGIVTHVWQL